MTTAPRTELTVGWCGRGNAGGPFIHEGVLLSVVAAGGGHDMFRRRPDPSNRAAFRAVFWRTPENIPAELSCPRED